MNRNNASIIYMPCDPFFTNNAFFEEVPFFICDKLILSYLTNNHRKHKQRIRNLTISVCIVQTKIIILVSLGYRD